MGVTMLLLGFFVMLAVAVNGSSNIARGKPAYSSSVLNSQKTNRPSNAVDGSTSTRFYSGYEVSPWWAVDLGSRKNIKEVVIINYDNHNLHDFVIGVMNVRPPTRLFPGAYKMCHKHVGEVKSGATETYKCLPNARGRFILIQMPRKYTYLLLREVAVYAHSEEQGNIARGKNVWESSHYKGVNRAAVAVDGSRSNNGALGQCTKTKLEPNPWWAVDLGMPYPIKKVMITNRGDCCVRRLSNYVVGVTNQNPVNSPPTPGMYDICKAHFSVISGTYTLTCDAVVQGRYVVVQIPGYNHILSLCEFEVYTYQ